MALSKASNIEDLSALPRFRTDEGAVNTVNPQPPATPDKTMRASTSEPTHDRILAASMRDTMSIIQERWGANCKEEVDASGIFRWDHALLER
jgi:hypothetical protein